MARRNVLRSSSLLRLRSGAFRRRYAKTAMGWRGAAVLRRNAAVALGNALDRSTVGALIESLQSDPHPMVRGHVAWALGRIGSPRAIAALRRQHVAEKAVARARRDRVRFGRLCMNLLAVATAATLLGANGGRQSEPACLHRDAPRARGDEIVSVPVGRSRGNLLL